MKTLVPLFCLTGLVFVGCSDQKTELAVSRIQGTKGPGYLRVLNLTSGDIEFWHKNRHVTGTVNPMVATDLYPIGTGEQTVRFEWEGKKQEVKTNLSTGFGSSVILMPDHTTKIVDNEQRYATSESNVHVIPVEAGGKLPSTANFSGGDVKSIPIKDSLILLNEGSINCPDGSTIMIKEKIAYSLFIIATPKKVYYILGKNASDLKPSGASPAAA